MLAPTLKLERIFHGDQIPEEDWIVQPTTREMLDGHKL